MWSSSGLALGLPGTAVHASHKALLHAGVWKAGMVCFLILETSGAVPVGLGSWWLAFASVQVQMGVRPAAFPWPEAGNNIQVSGWDKTAVRSE